MRSGHLRATRRNRTIGTRGATRTRARRTQEGSALVCVRLAACATLGVEGIAGRRHELELEPEVNA